MDFIRFIRRKSPDAGFDEPPGLSSDHCRPGPLWRAYHAMRAAAQKLFNTFRRNRSIDVDEPFPVHMTAADYNRPVSEICPNPIEKYGPMPTSFTSSTQMLVERLKRSGIRCGNDMAAERKLLWWNSLSPKQQAKAHPDDRPRELFERATQDDILDWWYSLTPNEQLRWCQSDEQQPAPFGRDPRPQSNDAGSSG